MLYHRIATHEFTASALPPDTFRVVAFEGHEAVSQPYRFEIHLVSNDPEIPFADLIDKPATLTMLRGDDPTEVDGVVVDFEITGMHDGQTDYPYTYRAVLAPRMSRLALHSQSRIFQHLTVGEIVQQVLSDAGVNLEMHLTESYEPREYCTQYKETDLDFVQRLLEYEGIHYCFRHAGGAETVVISDTARAAKPIAGPPDVPYRHGAGLTSADGAEFVDVFGARQQLVTGKTEITDYNYRTPLIDIRGESAINPDHGVGLLSDYGIHAATVARARRLARVRNEEIETTRLVMTGEGDCQRFRTGFTFDLSEHFRPDLNQTYLLTAVHHAGEQVGAVQQGGGGSAGSTATAYRNRFVCVPATAPYRPPRLTPEPKLPGVLTARVESAGGDYAPVDEFGRYHVRMPFDIGDASTAQASKAVRLAQPYTGPGYGHHFPVHKDTEMVIACVDGNVDRILGLSTIWNGVQVSPVTSDNAAKNVMRSWGKNELTFDDTKSAEEVFLNGTKNHRVTIANDESIAIGHDRTKTIGNDETLDVKRDQSETAGRDVLVKVGNDRTETVGNNETLTVGVNRSASVGTDDALTVGSNRTQDVGSNETITVGSNQSLAVGSNQDVKVGANQSTTVSGKTQHVTSGTLDIGSDGAMTFSSPSKILISSQSEIELVVGGSSIKIGPAAIEFASPQITSAAQVKNELSGVMVKVAATGVTEITGAMVKIN